MDIRFQDIRFEIQRLQRQWTPPVGLDRARPREVSLTGSGRAMIVLAAVLAIAALTVGIFMEATAQRQAEEQRLWEEKAVSTQGHVTRLWQRKQGDQTRHWIAYEFTANGRSYGRSARISRSVWSALETGSAVPVRYLPEHPESNHPFRQDPDAMPRVLPFLVALALGGVSWLAWRQVRREKWLLSEGRAAVGLVTEHSKMHRGSHGTELGKVAYYQFAQLSGALAKGKTGPSKKPPEIGSTICVLYDPENARWNARYPLSLVRPR